MGQSKKWNINSVNPLYIIISKANGYFEEINKNKYLTQFSTKESKEIIKSHEKLWSKIIESIRLITKNSGEYDGKYVKTKFNSDDGLPLNKAIEIHNATIVVRVVFHESNKYYPHVFLVQCLYELPKYNIAISKIKSLDYRCIISEIITWDAINFKQNIDLTKTAGHYTT